MIKLGKRGTIMTNKNSLDLETCKLVKEAMASGVTKEAFREFLWLKGMEKQEFKKRER